MSEIVADIKKYAEERKSIESHILKYIESEGDDDKNYQDMTESLSNYQNPDKKEEFKYIINLLGVISNHHYHSPNFYTKIERIILFFQEEIKKTFSKDDLFNLFDYNKRILLFFLQNGFISMDQEIAEKIFSEKYKKFHYIGYFSPEIEKWKEQDTENNVISIEQQVMACKLHKMKYIYMKKKTPISEFDYITEKIDLDSKSEQFRKSGNFESRICELIRNDSIDDFIIYLNQNDIKPTEKVERSIFELNYLLNEKEISLIEYACFYGSIKIFQYLQINGAELTSFLWDCAIYSNNAEMIQKLEELNVPLDSQEQCVIESIKCHNFDIFNYFSDKANMDTLIESCFKYCNFTCLNDVNFYENKSSFAYACEYNYPLLVKLFIKIGNTTINQPEINEVLFFKLMKNIFFILFLFYSLKSAAKNGNSEIVNLLLEQPGILIDDECFRKCKLLKNVKINSSIKSIGNSAFLKCTNLVDVLFEHPSFLVSIGERSFQLSGLTQIIIPSSVQTIKEGAFSDCESLEQIKFESPSSLTSMSSRIFMYCPLLKEIVIPFSVTIIEQEAFSHCTSLEKITFENIKSITEIENDAFTECKSLKQFEIPPKITIIKHDLFYNCSNLVEIIIPPSVTKIEDNVFAGCKSLKKLDLPSSITNIGNNVFNDCSSLIDIIIPSSVTSIGNNAFEDCTSLTKITIPSSVKTIGEKTFYKCISLKEVKLNSSLETIEEEAFLECKSLIQLIIPSSVISIGDKSFFDCSSLKELKFEPNSSLQKIGKSCFENCVALIQLILPSKVNKIGLSCFKKCSQLKKVEILSSSLSEIDSSIFFDCSSLAQINIPSSVTKINAYAFKNCKNLQQIKLPPNVTEVGISAFENCSSLKSLSFPKSVKSIKNWAFSGCTSLKEVTLPSSVDINFSMIDKNIKVNKF